MHRLLALALTISVWGLSISAFGCAVAACGSSTRPVDTTPVASTAPPAAAAAPAATVTPPPAPPAVTPPAPPAAPPPASLTGPRADVSTTAGLAGANQAGSGSAAAASQAAAEPAAPLAAGVKAIALPGAEGGVFLDYLAYDSKHHRVWVPAGGTGRVDVIDAKTGALAPSEGWPTKEVERRGQKRLVGPSAATVGDGVVFIGNRADSTVCAVDATSLAKKGCVTLDGSPDGLQWVAATKEVWVTTPRDKKVVVLDAKKPDALRAVGAIDFDGEPEGFAVDNKRKVFFTNLEDKDKTVVVDVVKRAVTKTWEPKCGEDGPKGLVFDGAANHLLVVCPAWIEVLDAGKDGALVSKLDVGDGLDAVDWAPGKRVVVAAAGRAAKLVIAALPASGVLKQVSETPTSRGARNAVVAEDGTAFVADGPAGRILMVPAAKK